METMKSDGDGPNKGDNPSTYDVLDRLERLESLREDLTDLGVRTLDEVELEIDRLNRLLDRRE